MPKRKITIEIAGVEVEGEVDYDYQPHEPMTRHYPGCPASCSVNDIKVPALEYGTVEWWKLAEHIEDVMLENMLEDEADYAADAADYHYERLRDERRTR